MKRICVDSSDKKRIITFVNENGKTFWNSTESYGRKLTSQEAELNGIVDVLKNIAGDMELCNDNESLIKMLNGESKVRQRNKPYIEKIRELCKNRTVKFLHVGRDINPASLKQRGFSFREINTPELRDWRLDFEKEMKVKYKERKRKTNERRRNKP